MPIESDFNLVRGAVKRALRSDDIIPNATDANPMSRDDMLRRFRTSVIEEMRSFSGEQVQIDFDAVPSAPDPVPESAPPEQKRLRQAEPMMIWQLHNKYLLAPIKSGWWSSITCGARAHSVRAGKKEPARKIRRRSAVVVPQNHRSVA